MENDNSPELIQERMQQTRNALTDKVAKLEEQVMGTVQTATDAMQTTVDTVKDTVDNVKSSVEETVCTVKDTVRQTFDVSNHVRERPWVAVGVAMATGFVVGRMVLGRPAAASASVPEAPFSRYTEPARSASRFAAETTAPAEPSVFGRLMKQASDELFKLGDDALKQVISSLRETVHEGVPRIMSEVEHRITGNGHSKIATEVN